MPPVHVDDLTALHVADPTIVTFCGVIDDQRMPDIGVGKILLLLLQFRDIC